MPLKVNIIPTIREDDGLAMSSRNAYLSAPERKVAPVVYRSLCAARNLFLDLKNSDETLSSSQLQDAVISILQSEPLVSEVQYVAVDSKATMQPLDRVTRETGAIISLACKVGSVRLIDNIVL